MTTARLRLRPRRIDDADALFATYADADAMRYWSHGPHRELAETREAFARPDDGWRMWVVTRAGEDRAIGFVAAGEKRQGRVSEIGYLLERAAWGQGIAAEMVGAVIDHLLIVEGQRRVFADTDPDNAASRALLERLGFRLEGLLRAEWETHLGVRDTALYGLIADDWVMRRA